MVRDNDYDDKKDEPTRPLDEDNDSPFSPPSDRKQSFPSFIPSKDSKLDAHEWYDEGEDDAAMDEKPTGNPGAGGDRPHKVF